MPNSAAVSPVSPVSPISLQELTQELAQELALGTGAVLVAADAADADAADAADVAATAATAVPITDITHDSKQCRPGMMFACLVGENHDGHDFATEAIQAGAVALLTQRKLDAAAQAEVPQLVVSDVREALGFCAAAIHHHPSKQVSVIGVTGTAGKTSTCHAISQMLNATGRSTALLGTLDGPRTTPEATDLNRWLAQVADAPYAVIEVSSHALALGRVNGIQFSVGVFTNLSPEHLDFHADMEDYFAAKSKLFDGRSAQAVVNIDNEWGIRLQRQLESGGASSGGPLHPCSARDMQDVEIAADCLRYTWRNRRLTTALCGRLNLANLAAAAATGLALGLTESEVATGLESIRPVNGRMQRVAALGTTTGTADDPGTATGTATDPAADAGTAAGASLGEPELTVLVDYAHKPDALAAALSSARELVGCLSPAADAGTATGTAADAGAATGTAAPGRVWVVFGAGGDRDKSKRPLMGEVAAQLADFVVITSDNPRDEDPAVIAAEIKAGCADGNAEVQTILSRHSAIGHAIANAAPADVVLIAGKGHEATQVDRSGAKPFADAQVAAEHLAKKSRCGK